VALLLVLGQHAPTRPLIDGWVGVTVFFCLSGFLITTLLIRELETGTIDLRGFYRRRAARLCPALAVVIVVTVVVLLMGRLIFGHGLTVEQILAPAFPAATYTTNLFNWFGHPFEGEHFNYTWSLSVEEHFYLLWPFALLWGYRRSPRLFAAFTVLFVGITLALNLYLGLSQAVSYDPHQYFGSDTNALPILVGSLLAIVFHNGWLSRTARYVALLAPLALALLGVLAHRNDSYHVSMVIVTGTGLTLLILIGVVARPRSAIGWLMASRPMRWLGARSYSIYLWNILARVVILDSIGRTVVGDIVWVVIFMVLAEVSYRFVERPLRAKLSGKSRVSGPAILDSVAAPVPRVSDPSPSIAVTKPHG
jgi:peptidoglycan/LPS O-acetylase OafA/YrhL